MPAGYYKFVLGFMSIIAVSLSLTVAADYYFRGDVTQQVATPVTE